MKKRLRKKRHIGEFSEFSEYGIEIRMINESAAMTAEIMDKFADDLLDYVDSRKWACGGGWSLKDCNFFIETGKNIRQAELAIQGFTDFLSFQKKNKPCIGYEIVEIKISDAWYPDRAVRSKEKTA